MGGSEAARQPTRRSATMPGRLPGRCGLGVSGLIALAALGLASCASVATTRASAPSLTTIDRGDGAYDQVVRSSRYVPVRDGVRLAVNVYQPAVDGQAIDEPAPAIFVFTPYRARYQNDDGEVVELAFSERLALSGLLAHGYVVVTADIRGKGASFGWRRGFQDRTEALDARDLITWIADQSWSTRDVGMLGCSYLGGTVVHAATTAPPELKAAFVGASDLDKYMFVRRGGVTAQFNTRPDESLSVDAASLPVDDDPSGRMLADAVAQHAHNTPMAPLWRDMPYRDSVSPHTGTAFWDEVGPATYLPALKGRDTAFYFWGNWDDEPTEQVILLARNVGGRLLVGPGGHCTPPPGMDFGGEIVRFFDAHLREGTSGLADEPPVTYWLENSGGDGRWVDSDALPGEGSELRRLYLSDDSLGERAGAAGEQSFTVDYDVASSEYFTFWASSQIEHGASWTSEPLSEPMTMVGTPQVSLKVSSDQGDFVVFAYLEEVKADGSVDVLSFGRLADWNRKLSDAPYDVMDMAWHSGRSGDALDWSSDEPARFTFALLPRARTIAEGSRLRLVVAGADPRQRNLAELARAPAPTITIHTGPADGSWVDVPVCRRGTAACPDTDT